MERRRSRFTLVLAGLVVSLFAAMGVGVAFGSVNIPISDVLASLGRIASNEGRSVGDTLVTGVRLPRVLLAAVVGAALSGAGALYQAVFRNPLADPYILGVSSGAGLGAAAAFVFAGGTLAAYWLGPACAFVGAVLTIVVVVRLATRSGRSDATSLLLAGVALSYVLAALTSALMVFRQEQMSSIVFWLMGGLQRASWAYLAAAAPMVIVGLAASAPLVRDLDVMSLGDERASHLGVRVELLRNVTLGLAALLTAAAVSVSGSIGFIGLIVPHVMRMLVGPSHGRLIPTSALGGAVVLVLADVIARTVFSPVELPVGIVTALLGGPFFIWLLVRGGGRR